MSFPNVIYGDYGDEKRAQSTKIGSMPIGTLMVLPDGSKHRHFRAPTGTALTAGYLVQTRAVPADTMLVGNLVPNGTIAVGATSVAMTTGGTTAVTTDEYEDGLLFVGVASTAQSGAGRKYRIKANNSAASGSATVTVDLYPEDSIQATIAGGTTTLGLRVNPYNQPQVTTADTVATGPFAGVPQVAVSAGFYGWLQRSGPSLVFVGGTALTGAGLPVVASTGVAGAVADFVTAAADTTGVRYARNLAFVGRGLTLGIANGFALVDLELEK